MDSTGAHNEVRIRSVTLTQRGVAEYGTLTLARHHLIFNYIPGSRNDRINADGASETEARGTHGSHQFHSSNDSTAQQQVTAVPRASRRNLWVPYPLINHCVLRPSHSQGARIPASDTDNEPSGAENGDFPPVFGTNAYTRQSTDSTRLAPYSSPQRPTSPAASSSPSFAAVSSRDPIIRIRLRDFKMVALQFHGSAEKSADETAREVLYHLRERCCLDRVQDAHSFHFKAPQEEVLVGKVDYEARREFARMGVGEKAAEGPGSAWRVTDINHDYSFSPTYPGVLCVPRSVSDNMLKYGGPYRSKSRIPVLTYLHSNGGSITRSSQPMPGIQGKRNPQDERLVSAIFSSATPLHVSPTASGPSSDDGIVEHDDVEEPLKDLQLSQRETALDKKSDEQSSAPRPRIYGSTRRNLIVDARPKINALANRATGGGIEDVSNYKGPTGMSPERVFLNIANIHVMRKSLDKIIESFGSGDFVDIKPDAEMLRRSGWLAHIAGVLDGAEMVARVVGLGGGHVLLHCSDGWDRTSQVAAVAEVMLDPHYRTLRGFITLVQKDFLSFGHKFSDRHGILGCEKWFDIENERVIPSRPNENGTSEANNLNTFSSKALSGAKSWFEKNRGTLFRQPNDSRSSLEGSGSRPPSPPPNPVLHSPATSSTVKDREHKFKEDEVAPIFHQFLDAIFQLLYQHPNAFEFNERFLRRLFYHVHASQYGEFLFNNEKARVEQEAHFPSIWPHFLSRREEFVNPDYEAKVDDPLLFPQRNMPGRDIAVRWWTTLFGRKDEEMNYPRALSRPDLETYPPTPSLSSQPSVSSSEGVHASRGDEPSTVPTKVQIKSVNESALPSTSAQFETKTETLAQDDESPSSVPLALASSAKLTNGDPLGVSSDEVPDVAGPSRLDFAAFARGSAFSDR